MWTDFVYALGDFFWWAFQGLEILGNNFNWLLIIIGFVMTIWWILQLVKFSKEAKENGTIE
jgi:tellurite resistance protein TehA-like permease